MVYHFMVIALGYKKRVGKDLFYKTVVENFPYMVVRRHAFADAVKNELFQLVFKPLGFTYSQIFENEEMYKIVRPMVQGWGQFRKATKGPTYWTDIVKDAILSEPNSIHIVTDNRFTIETDTLKALNAFFVLINRDTGDQDQHVSENELNDMGNIWDMIIDNNSTEEEYKKKVIDSFKIITGV